MEVRIGTRNLYGFIPYGRLQTQLWSPVKFDECRIARAVHQPEAVNTESFHHPQRARDGTVGHDPHHHMHGFRHERYEVPERIVGSRTLRKSTVGLHLDSMDEVGEFDGILNEEDRDVDADQVPITLLGVELDGEPAH